MPITELDEIPDDLFAGDPDVDYAGLYLAPPEIDPPERRIAARTSVRDTVVRSPMVPYPPTTGMRVAFSTELEAVLSYPDPPVGGVTGTVVTVRTASGDVNHYSGMTFVRWDDGRLMRVYATHLRPAGRSRVSDAVTRRVAGIGDLGDFLKLSHDTLVHKATKDLWALRKQGDDFVIERLFEESGSPLKV